MNVLPSKTVTERITFTVDFGSVMAWGTDIVDALITVSLFAGEDPQPQRVFWQIAEIADTKISVQVRMGLPGVIYLIHVRVSDGTEWYEHQVKLAILPDQAIVPWALTRTVISKIYPILIQEAVAYGGSVTDGLIDTIVVQLGTQATASIYAITPTGGLLRSPLVTVVLEEAATYDLLPTGGVIRNAIKYAPPDPEIALYTLIPTTGELDTVLIVTDVEMSSASYNLTPTGGSLT